VAAGAVAAGAEGVAVMAVVAIPISAGDINYVWHWIIPEAGHVTFVAIQSYFY
jgi:hypothetical protein